MRVGLRGHGHAWTTPTAGFPWHVSFPNYGCTEALPHAAVAASASPGGRPWRAEDQPGCRWAPGPGATQSSLLAESTEGEFLSLSTLCIGSCVCEGGDNLDTWASQLC